MALLGMGGFKPAGGGGTDDQNCKLRSPVDTTAFNRNLTSSDDTVQAALETIDGFTQYQGNWQQASWPAGVIVTRSGIAYISLVNNNTQIPTPASTQWAGLTEGFTYRGEAPDCGDELQLRPCGKESRHGFLLLLHQHNIRFGCPCGYCDPCKLPSNCWRDRARPER